MNNLIKTSTMTKAYLFHFIFFFLLVIVAQYIQQYSVNSIFGHDYCKLLLNNCKFISSFSLNHRKLSKCCFPVYLFKSWCPCMCLTVYLELFVCQSISLVFIHLSVCPLLVPFYIVAGEYWIVTLLFTTGAPNIVHRLFDPFQQNLEW